MNKQIIITCCRECPYYQPGASNKVIIIKPRCQYSPGPHKVTTPFMDVIKDTGDIPDWCPLEDQL